MIYIVLIALAFLVICFPKVRCVFSHPILSVRYGATDLFYWFKLNKRNLCRTGELVAYVGLFGKGKTLSAVHEVVTAYNRYDGLTVWCPRRRKMVTQRVHVISNVSLSVPYEDFISLEQIVLAAERSRDYDDLHDTLTVTLVLGDEFSVQMNSREFKKISTLSF